MTTLSQLTREWSDFPMRPEVSAVGVAQKTAQQRQRQGMAAEFDRSLL
jgi:hypothetical protein